MGLGFNEEYAYRIAQYKADKKANPVFDVVRNDPNSGNAGQREVDYVPYVNWKTHNNMTPGFRNQGDIINNPIRQHAANLYGRRNGQAFTNNESRKYDQGKIDLEEMITRSGDKDKIAKERIYAKEKLDKLYYNTLMYDDWLVKQGRKEY